MTKLIRKMQATDPLAFKLSGRLELVLTVHSHGAPGASINASVIISRVVGTMDEA